MEKCPRCENPYLAIRQDIYKDKRNFIYCDCCGFLIEEAAIGLISPRCAVIEHPSRRMIPLDEVINNLCKDNPEFAAKLLAEQHKLQKKFPELPTFPTVFAGQVSGAMKVVTVKDAIDVCMKYAEQVREQSLLDNQA